MKPIRFLSIALIFLGLAACTKDPLKSFPPELAAVKNSIESAFADLDDQLQASAARLGPITGDTTAVRLELKAMVADRPDYVIQYSMISPPGILQIIEPRLSSAEGINISSQAHIRKAFQDKLPVLSETFLAVEGFYAVIDLHPVLFKAEMTGAVDALFQPAEMLDPIIRPLVGKPGQEIWMMETGGTLIWDQDQPDIGRNLFTDPYYDPFPNLKIALEKIVAEEYGETTYSFFQAGTTTEVVKRAHWVTCYQHDQAWKIVHVTVE